MAIEKIGRHKSPCIDQIPAELIKAGCRTIHSEIHRLVNSIWNNDELPKQYKESFVLLTCKKSDKTDSSNYRRISHLSTMQRKLLGIINMDFDGTRELLIIYFAFIKEMKKMGIH